MNRNNARARVHRAQVELEAAEQQLAARWQPWRERFRHHRLSVLIGGGLLGGLVLATVPPKGWARVGAAVFGGSTWLVRSAIGPAILGALWTGLQNPLPAACASATAGPARRGV